MDTSSPREPWWLHAARREAVERAARAAGPGGQHVNKTSSAVELRFDVRGSTALPDDVRERLEILAGPRLTQEGVLVVFAQEYRSAEMNRRAARDRLTEWLMRAAVRPKRRRPTRPTRASVERRLTGKATRAKIKNARGRPAPDD